MKDFITGDDQQVRAAVVKLLDLKRHTTLLRRSVQHLYPIEEIGILKMYPLLKKSLSL